MHLKPWELDYTPWNTQAAFFAYLRGGFRRGVWERHPVKIEFINRNRTKAPIGKVTKKNPEGMVWACRCSVCNEIKRQSYCEVDHIEQSGTLRSEEDIASFVIKLSFISFEDLRIVCKLCHSIISHSQKTGMSFEEAKQDKKLIALCNLKLPQQRGLLLKHFSQDEISNKDKRKECFRTLLKEGVVDFELKDGTIKVEGGTSKGEGSLIN